MFPLSADKLSFLDIAKFWSREIQPLASQNELLAQLEAAWWRAEIIGDFDRLKFLKTMFKKRKTLKGIGFVTPNDSGPPISTPLASGEVVVNMRPRISVPGGTDSWTEDSCAAAFETLAGSPCYEYFRELSTSMYFIELTCEEFFGWVVMRSFVVPKFWKRNSAVLVSVIPPTGRGAVTRAIKLAYKDLFQEGLLPIGMSATDRKELIRAKAKAKYGVRQEIHFRTIERALNEIKAGK
jgi:hypothetical protein